MQTSFSLGSVSTGTLRPCDLVEAFIDALDDIDPSALENIKTEHADLFAIDGLTWEEIEDSSEAMAEGVSWLLDELTDALNECCPVGVHFGAHEGDGADFGFWPSSEWIEEFGRYDADDECRVDDLADVPEGFSGTVMVVSDHGNVTVYSAVNGELTELWSCV